MLEVTTWDTLCLRFIPREFPLDPVQRRSAQRLLRMRAGTFKEFMGIWLVPETLFGGAAGLGLYLTGMGLVISALAVVLAGIVLWVHFAIHMRARVEPHLCEVLLGLGFVICPGCYYWLGQDSQKPQPCPECGLQAHVTERANFTYR